MASYTTFPPYSGWYNLFLANKQGDTINKDAQQMGFVQEIAAGSAAGPGVYPVQLPGQNVQLFWVDVTTRKIAVQPAWSTAPPAPTDPVWLKVDSTPVWGQFFTVPQAQATVWSPFGSVGLVGDNMAMILGGNPNNPDPSLTQRYLYGYSTVTGNIENPPQCQWLSAVNVNTMPTQSGWYFLKYYRPESPEDSAYVAWNGFLGTRLATDPAPRTAFYLDAVNHMLAVLSEYHPYMKVPEESDQVWLGFPDGSTQCSTIGGSPLSLRVKSQAIQWTLDLQGGLHNFQNPVQTYTSQQLDCLGLYALDASTISRVQFEPIPSAYPTRLQVLQTILTPVPPGGPDDEACQGAGGGAKQVCFYNTPPGSNFQTAALPYLSMDPYQVLGYNEDALTGQPSRGANYWGVGDGLQIYLQQPSDGAQLNNMQASICFGVKPPAGSPAPPADPSSCGCMGQNPDSCALDPSGYCQCSITGPNGQATNQICGLQCAPGLDSVQVGDCKQDPTTGAWVSHYQCWPATVIGVTENGKKKCKSTGTDPRHPPTNAYADWQSCYEQWGDCGDGYFRVTQGSRPGCYRVKEYPDKYDPCHGSFTGSCSSNDDACGGRQAFAAHSHGSCTQLKGFGLECRSDCADNRRVPPFGYFCAPDDSKYGNKWVQCKNLGGCPAPLGDANFRQNPNPQAWCVVGSTPYYN